MFIVKGKSDRKKKVRRYLFRLWWTEVCVIGVEASTKKEAEELLAKAADESTIDLSDTDDGGKSGTVYLGIDKEV